MPLIWNEIRNRAYSFVNEWQDETSENAEAKSFWDAFFHVFGITRKRVASFEKHVKKIDGKDGYIDLFWKGELIVEHKSKGKNLDRAHSQAIDYFGGLKEEELPKYILVSDFERFRLYNMDKDGELEVEFNITELPQKIKYFGFIAGYEATEIKPEDPVNIKAAEKMGKLHDQLKEIGYTGHNLEIYLVRLLFCLFAEDTGIFEKNIFHDFIQLYTREDGSDLAAQLNQLFQVLNTPSENRLKILPEYFAAFEYINGDLFSEQLRIASFDSSMRKSLLAACRLDWGKISPAIFGSLFQSVMDAEKRRNFGAHYTSETNILKLINPLFLNELKAEFEKVKKNRKKLLQFHRKLAELKFFDPACGCGNFLVITYRELRLLELKVLKVLYAGRPDVVDIRGYVRVNVDQFYGIEYEEFPAQIAQVAMWLVDHQMNILVSEAFGEYFHRLPLKTSATIIHGNALEIPWDSIVAKDKLCYILGNPPYVGKHLQSHEQKQDMTRIFAGITGAGNLDYVAGWYWLAGEFSKGTHIKTAFVSTNSISQGEQAGTLWNYLFNKNDLKIHFAHQTFKWGNEGTNNAAVHCVIIGFACFDVNKKTIWLYDTPTSEPLQHSAKNISPYLVDGSDIAISNRTNPICDVPKCGYGSKPTDGGNLILSDTEKEEFLSEFPEATSFVRPLLSAQEYLQGRKRWCIWLKDIPPNKYRHISGIIDRVKAVRDFRLKSKKTQTREKAAEPMLFAEIRQPTTNFIVVPQHSSENRKYIPFGFFRPEYILHNSCSAISNATLYHFGIISSEMHMVWVRCTCGRIKSDYRYSTKLVYNNFPWPQAATDLQKKTIELAAQTVLDTRLKCPDSTLADLYDPLTMPVELTKAHEKLDRAVDKCYRHQPFPNEMKRMEFLFNLYEQLTQ